MPKVTAEETHYSSQSTLGLLNCQRPELEKPLQKWIKHGSHILCFSLKRICLVDKFKMWISKPCPQRF